MSDSGRSEENLGKEQIMGGGPPKNGAKLWPKTKKPGGGRPGPGASVIGRISPPLGTEIHRRPYTGSEGGEGEPQGEGTALLNLNLKEPYTPPRVPSRPFESPPPPPPRTAGEEKVKPGEKELHSVARSKVKTNPRTRSTPRKIKEVMTHEETQKAAVSPSCCERVKVNQKLSWSQSPVKRSDTY